MLDLHPEILGDLNIHFLQNPNLSDQGHREGGEARTEEICWAAERLGDREGSSEQCSHTHKHTAHHVQQRTRPATLQDEQKHKETLTLSES